MSRNFVRQWLLYNKKEGLSWRDGKQSCPNEKRQLQDKIDDYKKAIRTLEESKDEINYQDKIIENIFSQSGALHEAITDGILAVQKSWNKIIKKEKLITRFIHL